METWRDMGETQADEHCPTELNHSQTVLRVLPCLEPGPQADARPEALLWTLDSGSGLVYGMSNARSIHYCVGSQRRSIQSLGRLPDCMRQK